MRFVRDFVRGLRLRPREENGQALAEVSLIFAFVLVLCVEFLAAIGGIVLGYFEDMIVGFG
jgi:Flp pilus assembly pilin Flp